MKGSLNIGDSKIFEKIVSKSDLAVFNEKQVHPVCSTFALARDIEWSSRLFVLDVIEEDEEGIGTLLTISHQSPAFVNDLVIIESVIRSFEKNELICSYVAKVEGRVIAKGQTGQKVLKKKKIEQLFSKFKNG
ncbi:MAG: hypothetical protein OEW67_01705 [Cyclobacteriaceae bacterium]|nr:hypothetical protein [Cyclobacteriaceae bacterium]